MMPQLKVEKEVKAEEAEAKEEEEEEEAGLCSWRGTLCCCLARTAPPWRCTCCSL
eukprot:jgi/Mesen1/10825/ME000093S10341